jgi:hypothetical protein
VTSPHAIEQLVNATDFADLQLWFRRFCAQIGEVKSSSVQLVGEYGAFCAFCIVEMRESGASEVLVRRFGFREIGGKVYLPLALSAQFERRAAARAA